MEKCELVLLVLAYIQTENRNHLEDGGASGSWGSQSVVPGPPAAATPENLLEVQIRRPSTTRVSVPTSPFGGLLRPPLQEPPENQMALHSCLIVKNPFFSSRHVFKYVF